MSKPTVFISGANGFMAQHIVKQLLDSKAYKVVGSVRSAAKADQMKADFHNNPDLSFVFVEDLSKLDAFDVVFKEHGPSFDYILHTASPVNFAAKDLEKDVIVPAINGTKNIFQATLKYAPNVKKFVQTSSVAAMYDITSDITPKEIVTEGSWNPITFEQGLENQLNAYLYSKTAGEKGLWELHKSSNAKFPLVVINPTYVFGPQAFNSSAKGSLNASNEVISAIVQSKLNDDNVTNVKGGFIDVRDVARAQVEAISNSNFNGRRMILDNRNFSSQEVADIINANIPQLKGKIAKDVTLKEVGPGFSANIDNHVSKELLGFEFIDFPKTVIDTVDQILRV
ncbi:hypothetical protein ACO0RG_000115 [Hanseniaspora osmophila]